MSTLAQNELLPLHISAFEHDSESALRMDSAQQKVCFGEYSNKRKQLLSRAIAQEALLLQQTKPATTTTAWPDVLAQLPRKQLQHFMFLCTAASGARKNSVCAGEFVVPQLAFCNESTRLALEAAQMATEDGRDMDTSFFRLRSDFGMLEVDDWREDRLKPANPFKALSANGLLDS